jgi:ADP-ribosylglycohydrolase
MVKAEPGKPAGSSWSAVREQYPDGLTEMIGGGPLGWPAGHATDDTDLTRAVLLAYLRARPGGSLPILDRRRPDDLLSVAGC